MSKKLRFEVFKRDKFTCQYCGKQAPNVVLEVDHIKPASKKGTDNILNLITSCFDCNRGKTNTELDDDSVVAKQRKQLENLQERREQIELIFQWRNELDRLDEDTSDMVGSYIENTIENFSINDSGSKKVTDLTKKFGLADILESVDISADKYLRYDTNGDFLQESVENFINKIGGILVNKNRPPVEQKLSYIKGICRNNFNYWDDKSGSIILNNYVKALREHGWDEDRILNDLEEELMTKTKDSKNWSAWRGLVEKWTEDVNTWGKETNNETYNYEDAELVQYAKSLIESQKSIIPALNHIGKVFENFSEMELVKKLDKTVKHFLIDLREFHNLYPNDRGPRPDGISAISATKLSLLFTPVEDSLTYHLSDVATNMVVNLLEGHEIFREENVNPICFHTIYDEYISLYENKKA